MLHRIRHKTSRPVRSHADTGDTACDLPRATQESLHAILNRILAIRAPTHNPLVAGDAHADVIFLCGETFTLLAYGRLSPEAGAP